MHFHEQTVAPSAFISKQRTTSQSGKNSASLAVSLYLALNFEPQASAVPEIYSTWLDLPLSPSSHRHSASVPQHMMIAAAHHAGFQSHQLLWFNSLWHDWLISDQILSLGAFAQMIKLTLASVFFNCAASFSYLCDSLLHCFLFSSSHSSVLLCFPLKARPRFGVPFCRGELHLAAFKANSRERTHLVVHFWVT